MTITPAAEHPTDDGYGRLVTRHRTQLRANTTTQHADDPRIDPAVATKLRDHNTRLEHRMLAAGGGLSLTAGVAAATAHAVLITGLNGVDVLPYAAVMGPLLGAPIALAGTLFYGAAIWERPWDPVVRGRRRLERELGAKLRDLKLDLKTPLPDVATALTSAQASYAALTSMNVPDETRQANVDARAHLQHLVTVLCQLDQNDHVDTVRGTQVVTEIVDVAANLAALETLAREHQGLATQLEELRPSVLPTLAHAGTTMEDEIATVRTALGD